MGIIIFFFLSYQDEIKLSVVLDQIFLECDANLRIINGLCDEHVCLISLTISNWVQILVG